MVSAWGAGRGHNRTRRTVVASETQSRHGGARSLAKVPSSAGRTGGLSCGSCEGPRQTGHVDNAACWCIRPCVSRVLSGTAGPCGTIRPRCAQSRRRIRNNSITIVSLHTLLAVRGSLRPYQVVIVACSAHGFRGSSGSAVPARRAEFASNTICRSTSSGCGLAEEAGLARALHCCGSCLVTVGPSVAVLASRQVDSVGPCSISALGTRSGRYASTQAVVACIARLRGDCGFKPAELPCRALSTVRRSSCSSSGSKGPRRTGNHRSKGRPGWTVVPGSTYISQVISTARSVGVVPSRCSGAVCDKGQVRSSAIGAWRAGNCCLRSLRTVFPRFTSAC